MHGDIRPSNIMWFSSSFSMKLVDFARWSDKGLPTPLSLTLRFAAPEVSGFCNSNIFLVHSHGSVGFEAALCLDTI